MTVKELEKLLKQAGFQKTEGGNHSLWIKESKVVPFPRHKGDLGKGLLNAILKQAGLKDSRSH